MKKLIILNGLFLFCSLIVSCKDKDDGKVNTDTGGLATGAFTCECVKDSAVESISAKDVREAQTTCLAKGEGYKIKKCSRNK